ncbi:MAG: RT0821/Lpp0805 family surface protein [Bauldia sp.]
MLGGCSATGMPPGYADGRHIDGTTTGAILASAKVSDGVDPSDWEAVRRAVSGAPADAADGAIAWNNPKTGSEGSIDASAAAVGAAGKLCRTLVTTVNGDNGVRLYRGEACRRTDGSWQIVKISAADGTLS